VIHHICLEALSANENQMNSDSKFNSTEDTGVLPDIAEHSAEGDRDLNGNGSEKTLFTHPSHKKVKHDFVLHRPSLSNMVRVYSIWDLRNLTERLTRIHQKPQSSLLKLSRLFAQGALALFSCTNATNTGAWTHWFSWWCYPSPRRVHGRYNTDNYP
jgi:hypothetical protein